MKRATLAPALTLATATAVSAGEKPGQGNPQSQDKHAADKTRCRKARRRRGRSATRLGRDPLFNRRRPAHHKYYAPRYKSLPPGLQKKVARGGQLPPGWQTKMQPFPVDLERRLGALPRTTAAEVYDGHGVIYDSRSHVVIDVTVLF